jgi:TRAP transporter 4TM/12TM fusion protein
MLLFKQSVFPHQYLGIFLGLLLGLLFLIFPASPKLSKEKLPWYDLLLCCLSIAIGLYVGICYPSLIATIGVVTTFRTLVSTVFILMILEGTRRLSGWILVGVLAVFLLYYNFGYLLPGMLRITKISYGRMATQLFLGADAVFGVALRTAVMIVFSFILFAQVLFTTGGAQFIFNIADKFMGRFRGGSAKTAIIASTLFGMVTGSPVANVAATGSLSIPMMKDAGYEPEFASGVSAVAATGSCICPPILGAAAFIIAEFLRVPYSQVVIVTIVPVALYFLSLFLQVDLRAGKKRLKGSSAEERPSMIKILKDGWYFIIPFAVLVYCIFGLYMRAEVAAFYAMLSCIAVGLIQKKTRKNLKKVLSICVATCRGMFEVAVICAAAGIIVGIMSYSGLGLTLSRLLTELAGNSLFLLSLMTAVVSIILGMGMPVTAAYLILAILVVPAMVEMGVPGLAAHMFVFYFGVFSFITPPVCTAVLTASSVGEASFMGTAAHACKLAIPGFIVPFLFIFNPPVALMGTPWEIVREIAFSIVAVVAVCFFLEGYLKEKLNVVFRFLFLAVSAGLFLPFPPVVSIIVTVFFVVLTAAAFIDGSRKRHSIAANG